MTHATVRSVDSGQGQTVSLQWRFVLPAVILMCLSTVSKLNIQGVEFTGGPTLATAAIVLFLWPVIREFANRGGSTEFLGLKLQLNTLERRTEEDYARKIAELRADLEQMRTTPTAQGTPPQQPVVVDEQASASALQQAIRVYKEHPEVGDWRARSNTDQVLISAQPVALGQIKRILQESPREQEAQMAAAVSLGQRFPDDQELESVQLLTGLLHSPFERVRYRAARSISRKAQRRDITPEMRRLMIEAVWEAVKQERAQVIAEALNEARASLGDA
jgi:hypothetical protein